MTGITMLNVDKLFTERPELFASFLLPSHAERLTVEVGELIKVAIGIREDEHLLRGRWIIVESRTESDQGPRFEGRNYYSEEEGIPVDIRIENMYRIEPRHYYLWGRDGIPSVLLGDDRCTSHRPLDPPCDRDGMMFDGCSELMLTFQANGHRSARRTYEQLRASRTDWPDVDELNSVLQGKELR
jgi:hypothetical protein